MSDSRKLNTTGVWPKSLTVDKRIISTLSKSTYNNFPQALKELIVNSYDADALNVKVEVNKSEEFITIQDDGKGMSEQDFSFYLRIAGKNRKKKKLTDQGRKIVGKFGVGFLAVFPFCHTYEIETSKLGSSDVVYASIDCQKYFSYNEDGDDIENVPIYGGTEKGASSPSESFTRISLLGFTDDLHSFFNQEYRTKRKTSISEYSPINLIKWTLSEYLPISYKREDLNKIFHLGTGLPFVVRLNGEELFRNAHVSKIFDTHKGEYQSIGKIRFRYFVGTQMKTVRPAEARYILIRNHNVGVGERTTFGIGLDGRLYAKLAWLSIDVDVIEGLNDQISVSRDKFNFSPEFERFKEFFRGLLRHWAHVVEDITSYQKIVDSSFTNVISDLGDEADKRKKKLESTLKNKGIEVAIEEVSDISFEKNPTKSIVSIEDRADSIKRKDENGEPALRKIKIQTSSTLGVRRINIGGELLELRFEKWTSTSLHPLCRIEREVLFVNQDHPLLKNKKQRDVIIKVFAIIALNYENQKLDRSTAVLLNNQLTHTFTT